MTAFQTDRERDAFTREIKDALVDVPRILERLDIKARKERNSWKFQCISPSHEDKTPSCSARVGPEGSLQLFCFGCELKGDVFTLIALKHGFTLPRDFTEVRAIAAELAGRYDVTSQRSASQSNGNGYRSPPPRPPPTPKGSSMEDTAFDAIARFLLAECTLDLQPDVAKYVADRDIFDMAHARGLGALPPSSDQASLIEKLIESFGRDALRASGIVNGDEFRFPDHRLLIPWRGRTGEVQTLQQRVARSGVSEELRYRYPPGRGIRQLFGVERFDDQLELRRAAGREPFIAITEGAIDALSLSKLLAMSRNEPDAITLGFPSASGAWRKEWSDLVRGRLVRLVFDSDDAGRKGALRLAPAIAASGAMRIVYAPPAAKHSDCNDVLVRTVREKKL